MTSTVLPNVTAVAIDGRALLIEGPSGSGKTSLALALIDRGAMLIGDDAVTLVNDRDQLVAAPPPNTRGKIEVRNVGIVEMPAIEAPVAIMLTLDHDAERYPLELGFRELEGVAIPLLRFAPGDAVQAIRAEYALLKHGLRFPSPTQTA
ncbi:HPr kinase/phosphorylase [Qipengyuania sp. RANM35]|uniref:HPr kinase/phosphorylase n=1 Tax=Qipengyuania sp. RANM35 TaxID=3068635 RepID=UPI0034DAD182